MSYSIIIPSNVASKLRKCVKHLFQHTPTLLPSQIIVVDDGALRDWNYLSDPPVRWVDGEKPFVYARNVNLGLRELPPDDDVIIMGDDVRMFTSLDLLAETARRPRVGIVSPAIIGVVGNPHQERKTQNIVRESPLQLCFVCVYIPRPVLDNVGRLDERFGY